MNTNTIESRRKFIPVKTFPNYFPEMGLTEGRLRWLIFNKEQNGFTVCIKRIGKRIFIDVDMFLTWIDSDTKIT